MEVEEEVETMEVTTAETEVGVVKAAEPAAQRKEERSAVGDVGPGCPYVAALASTT